MNKDMGGRVMPRPHTGLLVVDLCIYTHTHTLTVIVVSVSVMSLCSCLLYTCDRFTQHFNRFLLTLSLIVDYVMHPCSFSNGGTINLILTLTLTLTSHSQWNVARVTFHRPWPCVVYTRDIEHVTESWVDQSQSSIVGRQKKCHNLYLERPAAGYN